MAFSITMNELRSFYSSDRKMYVRLTMKLRRDPLMAIKVLAFWIWIEACGYRSMVLQLLEAIDEVVNVVAHEATLCVNFLENGSRLRTPEDNLLPKTASMLGKKLSIDFFHQRRERALWFIDMLINGNLTTALLDIVLAIFRSMEREIEGSSSSDNATGLVVDMPVGYSHFIGPSQPNLRMNMNNSMSAGSSNLLQRMNLNVDISAGLSHINQMRNMDEQTTRQSIKQQPSLRGISVGRAINMSTGPCHLNMFVGPSRPNMFVRPFYLNPTAEPWSPSTGVPQDERTMFLTFSMGYPMSDEELQSYFERAYGDCIDMIQMQEVSQNQQPLYARVVFRDATIIPMILQREQKAKFVINGKHVWMRKFIPKHGRGRQ